MFKNEKTDEEKKITFNKSNLKQLDMKIISNDNDQRFDTFESEKFNKNSKNLNRRDPAGSNSVDFFKRPEIITTQLRIAEKIPSSSEEYLRSSSSKKRSKDFKIENSNIQVYSNNGLDSNKKNNFMNFNPSRHFSKDFFKQSSSPVPIDKLLTSRNKDYDKFYLYFKGIKNLSTSKNGKTLNGNYTPGKNPDININKKSFKQITSNALQFDIVEKKEKDEKDEKDEKGQRTETQPSVIKIDNEFTITEPNAQAMYRDSIFTQTLTETEERIHIGKNKIEKNFPPSWKKNNILAKFKDQSGLRSQKSKSNQKIISPSSNSREQVRVINLTNRKMSESKDKAIISNLENHNSSQRYLALNTTGSNNLLKKDGRKTETASSKIDKFSTRILNISKQHTVDFSSYLNSSGKQTTTNGHNSHNIHNIYSNTESSLSPKYNSSRFPLFTSETVKEKIVNNNRTLKEIYSGTKNATFRKSNDIVKKERGIVQTSIDKSQSTYESKNNPRGHGNSFSTSVFKGKNQNLKDIIISDRYMLSPSNRNSISGNSPKHTLVSTKSIIRQQYFSNITLKSINGINSITTGKNQPYLRNVVSKDKIEAEFAKQIKDMGRDYKNNKNLQDRKDDMDDRGSTGTKEKSPRNSMLFPTDNSSYLTQQLKKIPFYKNSKKIQIFNHWRSFARFRKFNKTRKNLSNNLEKLFASDNLSNLININNNNSNKEPSSQQIDYIAILTKFMNSIYNAYYLYFNYKFNKSSTIIKYETLEKDFDKLRKEILSICNDVEGYYNEKIKSFIERKKSLSSKDHGQIAGGSNFNKLDKRNKNNIKRKDFTSSSNFEKSEFFKILNLTKISLEEIFSYTHVKFLRVIMVVLKSSYVYVSKRFFKTIFKTFKMKKIEIFFDCDNTNLSIPEIRQDNLNELNFITRNISNQEVTQNFEKLFSKMLKEFYEFDGFIKIKNNFYKKLQENNFKYLSNNSDNFKVDYLSYMSSELTEKFKIMIEEFSEQIKINELLMEEVKKEIYKKIDFLFKIRNNFEKFKNSQNTKNLKNFIEVYNQGEDFSIIKIEDKFERKNLEYNFSEFKRKFKIFLTNADKNLKQECHILFQKIIHDNEEFIVLIQTLIIEYERKNSNSTFEEKFEFFIKLRGQMKNLKLEKIKIDFLSAKEKSAKNFNFKIKLDIKNEKNSDLIFEENFKKFDRIEKEFLNNLDLTKISEGLITIKSNLINLKKEYINLYIESLKNLQIPLNQNHDEKKNQNNFLLLEYKKKFWVNLEIISIIFKIEDDIEFQKLFSIDQKNNFSSTDLENVKKIFQSNSDFNSIDNFSRQEENNNIVQIFEIFSKIEALFPKIDSNLQLLTKISKTFENSKNFLNKDKKVYTKEICDLVKNISNFNKIQLDLISISSLFSIEENEKFSKFLNSKIKELIIHILAIEIVNTNKENESIENDSDIFSESELNLLNKFDKSESENSFKPKKNFYEIEENKIIPHPDQKFIHKILKIILHNSEETFSSRNLENSEDYSENSFLVQNFSKTVKKIESKLNKQKLKLNILKTNLIYKETFDLTKENLSLGKFESVIKTLVEFSEILVEYSKNKNIISEILKTGKNSISNFNNFSSKTSILSSSENFIDEKLSINIIKILLSFYLKFEDFGILLELKEFLQMNSLSISNLIFLKNEFYNNFMKMYPKLFYLEEIELIEFFQFMFKYSSPSYDKNSNLKNLQIERQLKNSYSINTFSQKLNLFFQKIFSKHSKQNLSLLVDYKNLSKSLTKNSNFLKIIGIGENSNNIKNTSERNQKFPNLDSNSLYFRKEISFDLTFPDNNKENFNNIVETKTYSQILDLFNNIRTEIKKTLKNGVIDSLNNFSKLNFKDWIFSDINQIIILNLNLIFTNEVTQILLTGDTNIEQDSNSKEESLVSSISRKKKNSDVFSKNIKLELELLLGKYLDWFEQVLRSCKENSISSQNYIGNLPNVLITLINHMNILENLIITQTTSNESYEWMRNIRYIWDNSKKEIIVECGGWSTYMQFNFMGNFSRALISPQTSKVFLFNASCFREKSAALVKYSNEESGKNCEEIFEQFANSFWIETIHVDLKSLSAKFSKNVSESLNYVKRIFDLSTVTKNWIIMKNIDVEFFENDKMQINGIYLISKMMQVIQQEIILNEIKQNEDLNKLKMFCLMGCVRVDPMIKQKEIYLKSSARILNMSRPDFSFYVRNILRLVIDNANAKHILHMATNASHLLTMVEKSIQKRYTNFMFDFCFFNIMKDFFLEKKYSLDKLYQCNSQDNLNPDNLNPNNFGKTNNNNNPHVFLTCITQLTISYLRNLNYDDYEISSIISSATNFNIKPGNNSNEFISRLDLRELIANGKHINLNQVKQFLEHNQSLPHKNYNESYLNAICRINEIFQENSSSLSGENLRINRVPLIYGLPGSGKSTVINLFLEFRENINPLRKIKTQVYDEYTTLYLDKMDDNINKSMSSAFRQHDSEDEKEIFFIFSKTSTDSNNFSKLSDTIYNRINYSKNMNSVSKNCIVEASCIKKISVTDLTTFSFIQIQPIKYKKLIKIFLSDIKNKLKLVNILIDDEFNLCIMQFITKTFELFKQEYEKHITSADTYTYKDKDSFAYYKALELNTRIKCYLDIYIESIASLDVDKSCKNQCILKFKTIFVNILISAIVLVFSHLIPDLINKVKTLAKDLIMRNDTMIALEFDDVDFYLDYPSPCSNGLFSLRSYRDSLDESGNLSKCRIRDSSSLSIAIAVTPVYAHYEYCLNLAMRSSIMQKAVIIGGRFSGKSTFARYFFEKYSINLKKIEIDFKANEVRDINIGNNYHKDYDEGKILFIDDINFDSYTDVDKNTRSIAKSYFDHFQNFGIGEYTMDAETNSLNNDNKNSMLYMYSYFKIYFDAWSSRNSKYGDYRHEIFKVFVENCFDLKLLPSEKFRENISELKIELLDFSDKFPEKIQFEHVNGVKNVYLMMNIIQSNELLNINENILAKDKIFSCIIKNCFDYELLQKISNKQTSDEEVVNSNELFYLIRSFLSSKISTEKTILCLISNFLLTKILLERICCENPHKTKIFFLEKSDFKGIEALKEFEKKLTEEIEKKKLLKENNSQIILVIRFGVKIFDNNISLIEDFFKLILTISNEQIKIILNFSDNKKFSRIHSTKHLNNFIKIEIGNRDLEFLEDYLCRNLLYSVSVEDKKFEETIEEISESILNRNMNLNLNFYPSSNLTSKKYNPSRDNNSIFKLNFYFYFTKIFEFFEFEKNQKILVSSFKENFESAIEEFELLNELKCKEYSTEKENLNKKKSEVINLLEIYLETISFTQYKNEFIKLINTEGGKKLIEWLKTFCLFSEGKFFNDSDFTNFIANKFSLLIILKFLKTLNICENYSSNEREENNNNKSIFSQLENEFGKLLHRVYLVFNKSNYNSNFNNPASNKIEYLNKNNNECRALSKKEKKENTPSQFDRISPDEFKSEDILQNSLIISLILTLALCKGKLKFNKEILILNSIKNIFAILRKNKNNHSNYINHISSIADLNQFLTNFCLKFSTSKKDFSGLNFDYEFLSKNILKMIEDSIGFIKVKKNSTFSKKSGSNSHLSKICFEQMLSLILITKSDFKLVSDKIKENILKNEIQFEEKSFYKIFENINSNLPSADKFYNSTLSIHEFRKLVTDSKKNKLFSEIKILVNEILAKYKILINKENFSEYINSEYFYLNEFYLLYEEKSFFNFKYDYYVNQILEKIYLSLNNKFLFAIITSLKIMTDNCELNKFEENLILNILSENFEFGCDMVIKFRENVKSNFNEWKEKIILFSKFLINYYSNNSEEIFSEIYFGEILSEIISRTEKATEISQIELIAKEYLNMNTNITSCQTKIKKDSHTLLIYLIFIPEQAISYFKFLIIKYLRPIYPIDQYKINNLLKKKIKCPIAIKSDFSINLTNFLCSLAAYYEIEFYIIRELNFNSDMYKTDNTCGTSANLNLNTVDYNYRHILDRGIEQKIVYCIKNGGWLLIAKEINAEAILKIVNLVKSNEKIIHTKFKVFVDLNLIEQNNSRSSSNQYMNKIIENNTLVVHVDSNSVDDLEAAHDMWVNVLEENLLTDTVMNESNAEFLNNNVKYNDISSISVKNSLINRDYVKDENSVMLAGKNLMNWSTFSEN